MCCYVHSATLYMGEQYKKRTFKLDPSESLGYNVRPFRKMLQDEFSITTDEQLLRLDEIIKER